MESPVKQIRGLHTNCSTGAFRAEEAQTAEKGKGRKFPREGTSQPMHNGSDSHAVHHEGVGFPAECLHLPESHLEVEPQFHPHPSPRKAQEADF